MRPLLWIYTYDVVLIMEISKSLSLRLVSPLNHHFFINVEIRPCRFRLFRLRKGERTQDIYQLFFQTMIWPLLRIRPHAESDSYYAAHYNRRCVNKEEASKNRWRRRARMSLSARLNRISGSPIWGIRVG